MRWEPFEQFRATVAVLVLTMASVLLLVFQDSSQVRALRAGFFAFTFPEQKRLLQSLQEGGRFGRRIAQTLRLREQAASLQKEREALMDELLHLRSLAQENERLSRLLGLQQQHWPRSIPARVIGRDLQVWFQSIWIDKGREEGVTVPSAVIDIADRREGLVGRVVEISAHTAKVMLLQDPLSAVAAATDGGEDGVLEGTNGPFLRLRYLPSDSSAHLGDRVVTTGLGGVFPPGIQVGHITEILSDPLLPFRQAMVRPVASMRAVREVLVLVPSPRLWHGESL